MTLPASAPVPIKTTLIDVTNCIGCRACQVACKQWNEREGEETQLLPQLGFQNPATLSANTYTLISFNEIPDEKAPGGLHYTFTMRRCFHCLEPACESACPTTALTRQPDGPVTYDAAKCIGCRYCIWACPWDVPTAQWDSLTPKIEKCTHCADRRDQPAPISRNGQPFSEDESKRFVESIMTPACVKACPADALRFGEREEMLAEAHKRIAARPERYVDHIYGEKELGGTSVLYLSSVPFEKLGFPTYGEKPFPRYTKMALGIVPPAVIAIGAMLGAAYSLFKKRVHAVAGTGSSTASAEASHHVEFETLPGKMLTPFNWVMLALMALCGISFVARFALGLGGSTHLSDTYPWGLWILLDLLWSAVASAAFAAAGLIYIFQRKDLYGLGRWAVFLGFLSYAFVTVTLVADLGQPWHFYHLGLNHPDQSAMFVLSWCVGLYVTILLLEFLPVPLERWGLQGPLALLRRWSGAFVAVAATLFVFVLSLNLFYAAATAAVFGTMAWIFRARTEKPEPIMLAIAAVTVAFMQQGSLGSLFLLMPNKVESQWWSPVMPISFFLSAVVAGTAFIILVDMWISRGWRRPLRMASLASMGQVTFWALAVYLVFRLGDMALRGQLGSAFTGRFGPAFSAEIVLGAILPMVLLASANLRARPGVLRAAALLAVLGVVYNRANVVYFAMSLRGRMPWTAPQSYSPSLVEWSISVGLVAATIFLFGLGARLMPLLPKPAAGENR